MNIPKPAQYIFNFILGYCYFMLAMSASAFVMGMILALFSEKFEQPFVGLSAFLGIAFVIYSIIAKTTYYIVSTAHHGTK